MSCPDSFTAIRAKRYRQFVLLDRDGVLIVERHYLSTPDQVEILPGVIQGLEEMRSLGLGLVIVTNQSAVGRGYFDISQLQSIHARLTELLGQSGVALDGIYSCPHTPDDGCTCRKPRTGLVDQASQDLGFDPRLSYVIGDKACDIELGRRLGATTILITTGYGAQTIADGSARPDFVVDDLVQAARVIGGLLASGLRNDSTVPQKFSDRF